MAVAGVLRATERQMHLGADSAMVDIDDASEDVIDRPHGLIYVSCKDRRGDAIFDVVDDLHSVLKRLRLDEVSDRSEDFFLGDPHVWVHVVEDGRSIE